MEVCTHLQPSGSVLCAPNLYQVSEGVPHGDCRFDESFNNVRHMLDLLEDDVFD